ncbi:hypothetical protein B0F90DRAFT_1809157 [Multifurca ochricompacta]|uniref:Polyketide synthase n=1 Tax=Multifurca ochricompacta TaxID=376703 RepID=A0AAD4M7P7_9AGAM|nr:hypothetical protein B0F90DRAFT_1809157 [Multifurca ochricompacta]
MERLNIPVFSGQGTTSINSRGVQGEALISSSSSAGGLLLSSCFEAFHSELSSLSAVDLEMTGVKLPDFDRPSALLVVSSEKYYCNPVISGSRLFLIQTLIYLEWATRITEAASNTFATLLERNRRYGIGLIGFSSGIITACVAGTSATILDFLSNAVSAFRVALWIGQNDNRSWSCVLFGIGRRAAEEAISQFCLRDGGFLSLHVTVVHNERCITVSGRPDILSSFVATLPETVSAQEASVCAMYHSPVHNDRVRGEVLADLRRRKIRFPSFSDIIFPIRSTFTGQILEEDQRGSLLEFVVDMIVIQPVNWDKVKMAVAQSIPEDEIAHLINIGPGTGLVRSVEKALRRGEPAEGRIAVIGMAVNMPGAPDVSKLWEILEQGINTVTHGRSMKARTGNFLDDVDKFDHEFFNISPREARSMDPQMRILLHTAYEALEDSGTGTLRAFLSGRISYAMVVDTACSSSLVAIYQACRSLLNGDCSAALAGGVNVIASPDMFIGLDRGHFLSPAGQCKVFDASADGYSRGEGCGLFVLKRLSDAQAENDRILGVIRGVQVNQSGTARSITQPDVTTQVQLFRRLLERSGVAPEDVNVLEAHGTGTQSGDVSEIESVRRVFTPGRAADNRLHITSVKANIGHLEAASGAAGLAKLLLMLQHRIIPPLISLGLPRMALLNNFGAAGSNAALLLEEGTGDSHWPYIFGLSAKTEAALVSMRAQLIDWLDSADFKNVSLCDIAYSLTARRQIYQHRMSLTAATRRELVNGLQSNLASVKVARQDGKVAFVFSGQGGQYLGMGNSLYKSVPLFQSIIDKCHSFLVKAGFPGIVQLIGCEQDYCKSLEETDLEGSHSAIFALEYGLSQLWISWGINPALVVGHSLGEYVAQAVAGVLTLQDALILVAGRARLMVQKCVHDSTGMMAVNLSAVVIGNILASSERFSAINIACYNSPDDHVVSGPVAGLQALKSYLGETVGCKTTLISASFGYHSDAMRPLQDDLILLAQHTPISPPVVLPGDASVFNPQYYSRHCTEPVFFEQGIRAFVANAWIEIGPHPTILPALRKHPAIQEGALFLASMRKLKHPLSSLYSALAQLYNSPCRVNWQKVFARWPLSSNTSLPTYPWSKTKEKPPAKESPELPYAVLGARVQVPFSRNGRLSVYETPISHLFKGKPLCPASIYQELALAAVEASVLLRHSSLDSQVVVLHDADFLRPLVYSEDTCHTIQASIVFETGSTGSWKIESTGREGKNSETHTQGNFQLQLSSGIISKFNTIQPIISHGVTSLVSKRDCKTFTTTGVYQVFFPRVVTYGKDFHAIQTLTISADDTEGYAVIKIPDNANRDRFVVHPVLMDAMLHVAGFIANTHGKVNDALICTKVGCLEVLPRLIDSSTPHCVYVQCSWLPEGDMLAESYVLEPGLANLIVARVKGIFFRKMPLATLEHGLAIAAAATSSAVTPILPQLLEPKNATTPFGLSRPLPCSQQLFEVQEEAARSVSGSLLGPDTKPGGAVAELVGEDVETVCGTGSPDVSLSSGILAGQFPFLDDDVYQSDVKTLLAAVLGLEVEELREDADLESLGLDSLASIEAHHALQSHFAIALPSDLFVAHKSVKAVYSFITGRLCTSLKHVNSPRCLDTVPILVQSSDVPGRAPLFLVHDGSGLVKYIHNLSSLGRDLWGIHNPHFISSQPWESVVSMATEYAKYTSEATRWSFGGIIAFEVARRLLKSGVAVSGVVLIDSPSPLNHLGSRHTTPSNTGLLVRRQFQMNSRMLLEYDPTAGSGPYPRLVLLHSRENYCPGGGLDVPDWLSKREDRRSAVAGWETIVGVPVKCIDIPGHHFQPFHSSYVSLCPIFISFTSSAIAEACSFLESAVESAEC